MSGVTHAGGAGAAFICTGSVRRSDSHSEPTARGGTLAYIRSNRVRCHVRGSDASHDGWYVLIIAVGSVRTHAVL
jgi:hypothetical protein